MKETFDPQMELIVIQARIEGPRGRRTLRLALDTGASLTMLRASTLFRLGYDLATAPNRLPVTTASGVEYVPHLPIDSLEALGTTCRDFAVVAHNLPPTAGVDGLLGLDFFRGRKLTLDFRAGTIDLD